MIADVSISCDGNWICPEVQFSGSAKALADLGSTLNGIKYPVEIKTKISKNKFYPFAIQNLLVHPTSWGNDRLSINIDESNFKFEGTLVAINKIADSLINFFDKESEIGDHFHIDYYDGNQTLNETSCHLVFICDQ